MTDTIKLIYLAHHQQTKVNTMSIEKTFQGAYKISAVINGYLVSKQYMGYTKREAIQAFKEFTKQG